jgi:hypothetical protein
VAVLAAALPGLRMMDLPADVASGHWRPGPRAGSPPPPPPTVLEQLAPIALWEPPLPGSAPGQAAGGGAVGGAGSGAGDGAGDAAGGTGSAEVAQRAARDFASGLRGLGVAVYCGLGEADFCRVTCLDEQSLEPGVLAKEL